MRLSFIKFIAKNNQKTQTGYLYQIKMFDENTQIGSFTTSKIKDYYYVENIAFESAYLFIEGLINLGGYLFEDE
ncbi:hypothetical protein COL91_05345 [Bacillus pseudomycoides]|nr:hypothetical protein COO02_17505 [Bacillus pseudomycoides]PEI93566.1 hypothetical protein CN679_07615 [Bacillus pseudomycoides]PGA92918.1 hypothetical protein COL91_05345 [Bacillus pseudomycoides]PHF42125.1 hypothetical protein COF72_20025 [Bacillus pseudomycoides]